MVRKLCQEEPLLAPALVFGPESNADKQEAKELEGSEGEQPLLAPTMNFGEAVSQPEEKTTDGKEVPLVMPSTI